MTNDEITILIEKYQEAGDPDAMAKVVEAFQPLVQRYGVKYGSPWLPVEDVKQLANMGLVKAAKKFDISRGTRFSSCAIPEMIGHILNFYRDNDGIVKCPRMIRRAYLDYYKTRYNLAAGLGRLPTYAEVAEHTGMTVKQIEAGVAWADSSAKRPVPFSMSMTHLTSESIDALTVGDFIGNIDDEYEQADLRDEIRRGLECLDERSRRVVMMYYWNEMSQREIGNVLNLSQMHVSRILAKALRRMRYVMTGIEHAQRRAA